MRKRRKEPRQASTRTIKVVFAIAFAIFLVISLVYVGGRLLVLFTPEQQVFASPYTIQNQFIGIDQKLQQSGFEVMESRLTSDKTVFAVKLEGDLTVLFTNEYPIDWQMTSLQRIISKLTIENKHPKLVDFGFDKPMVKF